MVPGGVGLTQVWVQAPSQPQDWESLAEKGLLCPMPGTAKLPGVLLNLILSFSQGRELICSLVRCWEEGWAPNPGFW